VFIAPTKNKKFLLLSASFPKISEPITAACPEPIPGRALNVLHIEFFSFCSL